MEAAAMDEHNEKIDADILKGREDILRARRAAANGRQSNNEAPDAPPEKSSADRDSKKKPPPNVPRELSPMMKAVVDASRRRRTEHEVSDVPVFDVAKKVLARQRQQTAAKRTAPPKILTAKPAEQTQIQTRIDQLEYNRPSYNSLVAEIVTRDIDRLCRGQSLKD
jgi:hypothetical protein